jgi:hypothetical protein
VRPRLGGRFEPASLVEDAIDIAKPFRRTATKGSEPDSKRERIRVIEAAEERDFDGQPQNAFDGASEWDQPVELAPAPHSRATNAPLVAGALIDPSPSLRDPLPAPQTITQSRFQEPPPKSARGHHQVAEDVDTTPAPNSSRTIKPSIRADDEREPVARPAMTRNLPTVERELETIVIREKPIPDESPLNQSRATPQPPLLAVSSNAREDRDSKTLPAVVHSRIAPLIETGPEPLQLNRPVIQPQPTIHVTIGRIEVRAVQSTPSPAKARAATPVMNLDDYLKRRSQGGAQ